MSVADVQQKFADYVVAVNAKITELSASVPEDLSPLEVDIDAAQAALNPPPPAVDEPAAS